MVMLFVTMHSINRRPSSSCGPRCEIAPANEVVGRGAERKHPIGQSSATMPEFAQQPHRFHPAKRLLDELAPLLTAHVPRVSDRAGVNGAAAAPKGVLRHVRRDAHLAD